jgi:hypothetical protein
MDDAERTRILNEAFNNVERLADYQPRANDEPVETAVDKLLREGSERRDAAEAILRKKIEQEGEHRLEEIRAQFTGLRYEIQRLLTDQREYILEVVGHALGEIRCQIEAEVKQQLLDEIARIRAEVKAQREVDRKVDQDERTLPHLSATRRMQ